MSADLAPVNIYLFAAQPELQPEWMVAFFEWPTFDDDLDDWVESPHVVEWGTIDTPYACDFQGHQGPQVEAHGIVAVVTVKASGEAYRVWCQQCAKLPGARLA